MMKNKKGQGGIVYVVIGIVIGLIVIVAVAVPITSAIVTSANLTGTNAIIAGFLTTFLLLGALVLVTMLVMGKMR